MYYLKFDGVLLSFIITVFELFQKCANLWKPVQDIINYSSFICSFLNLESVERKGKVIKN